MCSVSHREIFWSDTKIDTLADIRLEKRSMLLIRSEFEGTFIDHNLTTLFNDIDTHEVHRRRAYEASNKLVDWIIVEVQGRANLLDNSILHDDNLVAHCHSLYLVMSYVDHCRL